MPSIHHLFTIQASAKAIFTVITSPEGLNSWWTAKASGEPALGNEYELYFSKDYDWRAEVIEVDAPKQISWQMREADQDWLPTQLHFSLEESVDGKTTTVRFAHTSWARINDHFRRTSYCWAMYLNDLRKFVETGEERPYAERAQV